MKRRFRKDDIEFHHDCGRRGRERGPAVNVKVYKSPLREDSIMVATHNGDDADASAAFADWLDHYWQGETDDDGEVYPGCKPGCCDACHSAELEDCANDACDCHEMPHPTTRERDGDRRRNTAWDVAIEDARESLSNDVETIFGARAKVYFTGRSGGWAYVDGNPHGDDVDAWNAIVVSKWGRFAKYARALADDVPYLMVDYVYHNVYRPMIEARERAAENDALATRDLAL